MNIVYEYNRVRQQYPKLMSTKQSKVNSQLLTIVYGGIVRQVINDVDDLNEANSALQKIGYNIGTRIVDEFMVSVNVANTFEEIVHAFVKDGLKMFLGISVEISEWKYQYNDQKKMKLEFDVVVSQNPLLNYVELQPEMKPLEYQNIVCGIIRGALFTLNHTGVVTVGKDSLKSPGEKTRLKVNMTKEKITYGQD